MASERFLLYDAQFTYPAPLVLERKKDSPLVRIGNTHPATLHHLVFYERVKGVWRQGEAGDLTGHPMPATTQSATQPTTAGAAPSSASERAGPSSARSLAATHPSTQPADIPVQMIDLPAASPTALAATWRPLLHDRGLSDADCRVIVDAIAAALQSPKLTAVYLLDPGEFDRLLPLEILPQPVKTQRIGIVVVQNIDPNAGSEIDDLIAQLGDPLWPKREAAFKALQQMGTIPVPHLRKAIHSKDAEIAWRAEKLLAILGLPAQD